MSISYQIIGSGSFEGSVNISGAKNFSIKALVASLLVREISFYSNVPDNLDVKKTLKMLNSLGAKFCFDLKDKTCSIDTSNLNNELKDCENANMTTFLIASALLKYFDYVSFPAAKGCQLGDRLSDFHILAFNSFGVECSFNNGYYYLKKNKKLSPCIIELPYPSVGATETCLFLASIANGTSVIKNIAIEPEINALISILTEMGVPIFFDGDREIKIIGNQKLKAITNGYIHGDYIEVATWATLAAMSDGYIIVEGVTPELIGNFLSAYLMLGGGYTRLNQNSIAFFKGRVLNKSLHFETGVFPKLRTDLQPLLAAMASVQTGVTTIIHETVYNNRLDYIHDFNAFGCDLVGFKECLGEKCRYLSSNYLHSVVINGVSSLKSCREVRAKTVRSGMANILLASIASGETIISSMEVVERGYCSLFKKLQSVGVNISRNSV